MKYFVVADVHGFYDEMKKALDAAGFDPANENHTLVSLGDAIDRGPRPNEVIKYLVNLPRKILIRGNHEDLMDTMLARGEAWPHDHSNGTYASAVQLASKYSKVTTGNTISKGLAMMLGDAEIFSLARAEQTFKKYESMLVNYFETDHYVFVHGWIPVKALGWIDDPANHRVKAAYGYDPEWRSASEKNWTKYARWDSGLEMTKQGIFEPNKTIVCGHWHAYLWHKEFDYDPLDVVENHSPFIMKGKVICMDGCTAYTHNVPVMVLEEEDGECE